MSARVIVCSLGGDVDPWCLPASTLVDRTWIHGGERSLYEFATAATVAGYEVELRGDIVGSALADITASAGTRPQTELTARRPEADDIVVAPEGWIDPVAYARVAFSPARALILILGPPGLVGWDFREDWIPPDPLTVALDGVARPESFQGMAALGFDLLTNNRALADASLTAGVPCTFIGTGRPIPFPDAVDKTHDVAIVSSNRWMSMAEQVATRLDGASILRIPDVGHSEMLDQLGRARVLPWPGRIEGSCRFLNEARAMGTVPVALSNPFMPELSEESGGVVVGSLDEMPLAVNALLADPQRLATLSARGTQAARRITDWDRYVGAVREALATPETTLAGDGTRIAIGRSLDPFLADALTDELADGAALRTAYDALRRRSAESQRAFADRVTEARRMTEDLRRQMDAMRRDYEREIAVRDEQREQLLSTKTFRYTAALRRPYAWLRRRRGSNQG